MLFVADQEITPLSLLRHITLGKCGVCFLELMGANLLREARGRFGRPCEDNDAGRGAIQAMDQPQIHIPRFVVAMLKVGFPVIEER